MPTKSEIASVATFTIMLGVTGLALFVWQAATKWADQTGVVVSCIFMVLSGIQVALAVFWYRISRADPFKNQDEKVVVYLHNDQHMDNSNGNNGSLAAHRGDGDHSEVQA